MQRPLSKVLFEELLASIAPSGYLSLREFLGGLFLALKKKVKPFSYEMFSEVLGLSHSNALRLVIKGERQLSVASARTLAAALPLPAIERKYLIALAAHESAKDPALRARLFQRIVEIKRRCLESPLSDDHLAYFSEWINAVVRESVALFEDGATPGELVAILRVPIRSKRVEESLKLLERLGYLSLDAESGRYKATDKETTTSAEVRGVGLVRFHQGMIELGRDAVTRVPPEEREIGGLTLVLDATAFAKAKAEIQRLAQLLLALEEPTDGGRTVYQVNFQLFPFTQTRSRNR